MAAYYNEIDPFAAAWLRELIKAGHIAPGEVDERSITDVMPSDLSSFTQCHFFAGIGVWSHALRQAGWSDDSPVWTGSCPCQPFSDAGKGAGFKDERHLWPEFFRLIIECRPSVCFGEQVASKPGLAWLDLVQANLEGEGYAFGAVDTCAAGFGAPHIRQRLYWVGHTESGRSWPGLCDRRSTAKRGDFVTDYGCSLRVEHTCSQGLQVCQCVAVDSTRRRNEGGTTQQSSRTSCRLDNPKCNGWGARRDYVRGHVGQQFDAAGDTCGPGPVNGLWRDADWLLCRDGKWRPVEPGTFPLAHGAPGRVGRLRGYGNALNAVQAKAFIKAFMEVA